MRGLIDIHCHIVPGVDDGPRTLGEAMEMVQLMYEDGIRGVIATSHYNHIIDFRPSREYAEALKLLRKSVDKLYGDFQIYAGAEFRIRENYLEILDLQADKLVLNNTQCILIELQDDVDARRILDIVYEIKLRGYTPIIAHIERYRVIYRDQNLLRQLRAGGSYIQLSAKAITKRWSDYRQIKRLLKKGYIDFIASDGHSTERRLPTIGEAYQRVARICSVELAEKIFIENPESLLGGVLGRDS